MIMASQSPRRFDTGQLGRGCGEQVTAAVVPLNVLRDLGLPVDQVNRGSGRDSRLYGQIRGIC